MASIRKRGTRWQVQIRREGFPSRAKTFQLKDDALRWAREQDRLIDRGEWSSSCRTVGEQILADLLVRYEQEVTGRKKSATSERFHLRIIQRHSIARIQVRSLNSSAICRFRDDRLQRVSASTVRKELSILQHVLRVACNEWGHAIKLEQFKLVWKPPACKPRNRRLAKDELAALDEAFRDCRNPNVRRVFFFALATGMRRSEVLSLKWSNVNLTARIALLPMTKNGDSRQVPLSPQAVEVLVGLKEAIGQYCRRDEGSFEDGNGRVFQISSNSFRLAWERVKKRAGMRDFHFHDLRHEAISRFFERGLSVPEVALISGHRDPRMLFRYTHLRAEDVAKKLN